VRVTAEAHRATADVVPPADDRRVQRQDRVDLEHLAGLRDGLEGLVEFDLELRRVEGAVRGLVPRTDGVVDVGEDLERVVGRDHGCDVAQVAADDVRGSPSSSARAHVRSIDPCAASHDHSLCT